MIIDKALSKVFGTKHERDVKAMRPRVAEINALEAGIKPLSDDELRARVGAIRARVQDALKTLPENVEERRTLARETLNKELVESFALVREAAWRAIGQRHYDVQLMGGMVLHEGKIAEMRTGEGKTLVATLAVSLNALSGRGVHVVTVNDYLARRDADWMGRIYKFLGFYGRLHPARHARRGPPRGLPLRHHVRHEQRVRLRLPARQHEVRARADGPARARLRGRRRGRLDPHRRGPHAAHHLGPVRGRDGHLLQGRPDRPEARPRRRGQGQVREQDDDGRLPPGREGAHLLAHRGRRHEVRAPPRRREPLRPGEHRPPARLPAGPARPHALQAGRGVRREGRAGHHRRRVHGPPHARAPLVRRPPPGRRGEGGRQDREGKPDARDDHAPELLPHVRQAVGHDGHGRHRGRRVRQDLQARRRRDPDEPRHGPHRRARPRLPDRAREVRRRRRGDRREERKGPARPRRHDLDREVRASLDDAQEAEGPPRRPEREVPRAGSDDRRSGGPGGRRHDRDEHGRPRHGHPPRRQPRVPRPPEGEGGRGALQEAPRRAPEGDGRGSRAGRRARRAPHHRHRAPRVAPHRQPAPRPRRPPGRPRLVALLPLARGRPHADLRVRPPVGPHEAPRHGGRRPDRAPLGHEVDRARTGAGRGPQLRHPQAPPRVRRRHEQAARGDLPAEEGNPHGQARARVRRRPRRGRLGGLRRPALPRRQGRLRVELGRPRGPRLRDVRLQALREGHVRGTRRTPSSRRASGPPCARRTRPRRSPSAPKSCATSRSSSCSRRSTRSGRTTSSASTTSRKASGCAATVSAIPLVEYKKESFAALRGDEGRNRGADPPVPVPLRGPAGPGRARLAPGGRGRGLGRRRPPHRPARRPRAAPPRSSRRRPATGSRTSTTRAPTTRPRAATSASRP